MEKLLSGGDSAEGAKEADEVAAAIESLNVKSEVERETNKDSEAEKA